MCARRVIRRRANASHAREPRSSPAENIVPSQAHRCWELGGGSPLQVEHLKLGGVGSSKKGPGDRKGTRRIFSAYAPCPLPVSQARSRTFATDFACHCPPRAVATPRAFRADAISLSVLAPAFCASRMIGRTFAANLSASAVTACTALLRATESLGLPRVTPRAFAAASACRVRVEMSARSGSCPVAVQSRQKLSKPPAKPRLGDRDIGRLPDWSFLAAAARGGQGRPSVERHPAPAPLPCGFRG
jgi:hypothetical protein